MGKVAPQETPAIDEVAAKAIQRSRDLIARDPQLKSIKPNLSVYERAANPDLSCEQSIDLILSAYGPRSALGVRAHKAVQDPHSKRIVRDYQSAFQYKTFGELRHELRAIANAWRHIPSLSLSPDEFLIIIGFASAEFCALDTAAAYGQAVSVPMQSATAGGDLNDIFERIEPSCLAVTYQDLPSAVDLASNHDSLRSLIVFNIDLSVDDEREAFEAASQTLAAKNVRVVSYEQLIDLGKEYDFEFLPPHKDGDDRLALIAHSSGSTGVPKGAMISAASIKAYWRGTQEKFPMLTVIFSPLNHLLGRATLYQVLGRGSTAYFTLAPDMSTLFEDIRIARPTALNFFPRVLDMVYQHYQNEVVKAVASGETAEAAKTKIMDQMRYSFLGDRFTSGMTAAAPTSKAVMDFMAECFGVRLRDIYGSTEAGAGSVSINGVINRNTVLDYKIRDVPELGYYVSDKPYPRGELCFKGRNQIKGFFKDAKATSELLTDDGFIITGDIIELREEDSFVIIDRRKDVLKLSQGEYVAVGPLGAVFEGGSPFIKQIYIYGNSHRSYLVAVIVPDLDAVKSSLGRAPSEVDIRNVLRGAIQDVAKMQDLKSFEAPRDFIVETEPFTQENGLLSSVRKKLRPAIKHQYGEALEALYDAHEKGRDEDIKRLKNPDFDVSIEDALKQIVTIHLGLDDGITIADDQNFGELGGDSLGAVNFSLLVEDVFGITFPADKILDSTASIQSWAKDIERLKSSGESWASFASIHGAGSQAVEAKDLALPAFISQDILNRTKDLAAPSSTPKTVLLTGATGFLGRHVCLTWLSALTDPGAKLICLVRAKTDAEAKKRLEAIFDASAPEMKDAFYALSKDKLSVLAADIAMPSFGLEPEAFAKLAKDVDRICHVGALVNHRLSYEHLFAPNVSGTAEIIKLALSQKLKPIDFVSTVSVLPLLDRSDPNKETAKLEATLPLSDAYAFGYAASKWAAEILLRKASKSLDLPVNILRGNMMLAHQNYSGAINPSDMFTRLIFSLIATGIAPSSFYKAGAVNYDGLPVDLVANSVVNVRRSGDQGTHVFNIHNYNSGASFSLNAITDWIKEAGFKLEDIEDYDDWYQAFSQRLHALPEVDKQKSAIDLLQAFKNPQRSERDISYAHFQDLLAKMDADLPELGRAYISKVLSDMSAIRLLKD
ncbi:MAG: thioester reductase domain-containing protein [Hellea sp.]